MQLVFHQPKRVADGVYLASAPAEVGDIIEFTGFGTGKTVEAKVTEVNPVEDYGWDIRLEVVE